MVAALSFSVSLLCKASSSCLISFSKAASQSLASLSIVSSSLRGRPSVNRYNDGAIISFTLITLVLDVSRLSCILTGEIRVTAVVVETVIPIGKATLRHTLVGFDLE